LLRLPLFLKLILPFKTVFKYKNLPEKLKYFEKLKNDAHLNAI